jgi:hypothetical protein
VDSIYTKVQVLEVDLEAIKGTGFTKDVHSLVNIEGYTDSIPTDVWTATERTLTSEGASGATLAEIEGSLIIAKKAQIDSLGTPLQASSYVAPDNTKIGQIKDKVDTLFNYDDTILESKVDNIYVQTGTISLQVDALGTPLQASNYEAPDNTTIGLIKTKVDTLENYDDTILQGKVDDLGTPLQADDYIAPDNTTIGLINTKIDSSGATNKADLIKLNENVIKASKLQVAFLKIT